MDQPTNQSIEHKESDLRTNMNTPISLRRGRHQLMGEPARGGGAGAEANGVAEEEIPKVVKGIFAYLDAVLSDETKTELVNDAMGQPGLRRSVAGELADFLCEEFRLMSWGSEVRTALDRFRLYHKDDMAAALVEGYRLHLLGEDSRAALSADRCLNWGGILNWRSVEEVRNSEFLWQQFSHYYKAGDRFAGYSLPSAEGTMLLRGDRLVAEQRELQMCVASMPPEWERRWKQFEKEGGIKGFLARAE